MHTWTISKCTCGDPVCKSWFVSVVHSDGSVDLDDACLISASPDLLASLKRLIIAFPEEYKAYHIVAARAAIAKATG